MVNTSKFTETAALWNSVIDPGRRYLRERWTWPVSVVTAMLLVASGLMERPDGMLDVLVRAALALLLVGQFRIWDDLQDVPRDRVEHPERVLVNVTSTRMFHAAIWLMRLTTLGLLLAWADSKVSVCYVALCAVFGVWYHWGRSICRVPWVHTGLVLSKYPVFVVVLTPMAAIQRQPVTAIVVLVTLFVLVIGYEVWSEATRREKTRDEPS